MATVAPTTTRNYTRSYAYDEVGNISQMGHFCGGGSPGNGPGPTSTPPTPTACSPPANPATTRAAPYTDSYAHSARGAMAAMPHLADIGRDFRDQIRTVDLGSGDDAVYHYDSGGQRVRKVVRKGANTEERIYWAAGRCTASRSAAPST